MKKKVAKKRMITIRFAAERQILALTPTYTFAHFNSHALTVFLSCPVEPLAICFFLLIETETKERKKKILRRIQHGDALTHTFA
jgi:hypothetical protein